jgi:hypothetical protein
LALPFLIVLPRVFVVAIALGTTTLHANSHLPGVRVNVIKEAAGTWIKMPAQTVTFARPPLAVVIDILRAFPPVVRLA